MTLALKRVKVQEDRITDAYVNEAMELDRYKVKVERLRVRRQELERAATNIERMEQQEPTRRTALEYLSRFDLLIGMPSGLGGPGCHDLRGAPAVVTPSGGAYHRQGRARPH